MHWKAPALFPAPAPPCAALLPPCKQGHPLHCLVRHRRQRALLLRSVPGPELHTEVSARLERQVLQLALMRARAHLLDDESRDAPHMNMCARARMYRLVFIALQRGHIIHVHPTRPHSKPQPLERTCRRQAALRCSLPARTVLVTHHTSRITRHASHVMRNK
jgi:hypothetical protein